jgi:hypothetical protein
METDESTQRDVKTQIGRKKELMSREGQTGEMWWLG